MANAINVEENSRKLKDKPKSMKIGDKAKELEQKTMKERMKIDRRSGFQILVALLFYVLIMTFFYFFL